MQSWNLNLHSMVFLNTKIFSSLFVVSTTHLLCYMAGVCKSAALSGLVSTQQTFISLSLLSAPESRKAQSLFLPFFSQRNYFSRESPGCLSGPVKRFAPSGSCSFFGVLVFSSLLGYSPSACSGVFRLWMSLPVHPLWLQHGLPSQPDLMRRAGSPVFSVTILNLNL